MMQYNFKIKFKLQNLKSLKMNQNLKMMMTKIQNLKISNKETAYSLLNKNLLIAQFKVMFLKIISK